MTGRLINCSVIQQSQMTGKPHLHTTCSSSPLTTVLPETNPPLRIWCMASFHPHLNNTWKHWKPVQDSRTPKQVLNQMAVGCHASPSQCQTKEETGLCSAGVQPARSCLQDYVEDSPPDQGFTFMSQFGPACTAMFPPLPHIYCDEYWIADGSSGNLEQMAQHSITTGLFASRAQHQRGCSSSSQALRLAASCINISHTLIHTSRCTDLGVRRQSWSGSYSGRYSGYLLNIHWENSTVMEKTQHPVRRAHKNNPKPNIITHLCCELPSFS